MTHNNEVREDFRKNKPKWLTVAMPLLETIERLERDKTETRER